MPLDAVCLSALVGELSKKLPGCRVDKIHQPEKDELRFSLRGSENFKLLISANQNMARIHVTQTSVDNPQQPPMFCMLLRKHLVGAKILSVSQPALERCVIISFATTDEMGEKSEKRLVCEMMGRYSNIILVSADGHIIDVLKRVDAEMNPLRQLLPGLIYRNPPIQLGNRSFLELSDDEISQMLTVNKGREPEDAVLSSFIGISPLIAREMVLDGNTVGAISKLRDTVLNGEFQAVAVYKNGKSDDFSYMPLRQFGDKAEIVFRDNFSELLDFH